MVKEEANLYCRFQVVRPKGA